MDTIVHLGIYMVLPRAKQENNLLVPIVITLFFGFFIVPGIMLFLNYWKFSAGCTITFTDRNIEYKNAKRNQVITINNDDIRLITFCSNTYQKLPWYPLKYYSITDSNNKIIVVTSFIMAFDDITISTKPGECETIQIIKRQSYFPFIRIIEKKGQPA